MQDKINILQVIAHMMGTKFVLTYSKEHAKWFADFEKFIEIRDGGILTPVSHEDSYKSDCINEFMRKISGKELVFSSDNGLFRKSFTMPDLEEMFLRD